MLGTKLLPLNVLREMDEELYKLYAKKYVGREEIMRDIIPTLECLWNDVVFLNAVRPLDLLRAYELTGRTLLKRRFYRINPETLDHSLLTVLTFSGMDDSKGRSYQPFRTTDIESYSKIPEQTFKHYREMRDTGKTGLMFAFVPHILYKGEIDVSQTEIIEV